jgi:hypothetical protein
MLVGQPRAGRVRIAFDQAVECGDQHASLNIFATSTWKPSLGRFCHKIAHPIGLEQAWTKPLVRTIVRRWILPVLVLLLASSRAEAECVDPAMPTRATVSITRAFDEAESKAEPDLLGISGTGWLLSSRSMVTVAHVAEAMHRKDIEIRDGKSKHSIPVRLSRVAGAHSEKIAVLELADYFPVRGFYRSGRSRS